MARRKRGRKNPISAHSQDYKEWQKKQAASSRTTSGKRKTGEEKKRAEIAKAAQKLKKEQERKAAKVKKAQEKKADRNKVDQVADPAQHGKYGSKKVAPKAQGRKSSVKLTKVDDRYKDANGRVSYNPQSIRDAYKIRTAVNKEIRAAKKAGKEALNLKEMRQEYSRLRSAAVKRMERLAGAGFGNSQIMKYYGTRLPKLTDIKKTEVEKVLIEMLVDVNRFLASDLSTVKGQVDLRNQRILTLREYGYEVDWSNFDYLTDVLDYIRDEYQDLFFDSDQLIQDAVKYINEVINDPEIMKMAREEHGTDQAGQTLGDEVYERFAASSAELRGLSGL